MTEHFELVRNGVYSRTFDTKAEAKSAARHYHCTYVRIVIDEKYIVVYGRDGVIDRVWERK